MGHDFHRLVMVALAAGLLVIPGCGAGGGSGNNTGSTQGTTAPASVQPKIVSASLDGANSLKVTFSEPVQPSTDVDPSKFRLTIGYYSRPAANATAKYSYDYYYSGAYDYTRYDSNAAPVTGILSEQAASTEAVLLLGPTFDVTAACASIAAQGKNAGLYLHYSSEGSPTIQDANGKAVPSVAAFWESTATTPPSTTTTLPIPVTLSCATVAAKIGAPRDPQSGLPTGQAQ